MADGDPSGERVAKQRPLEGHFEAGGEGLYVHTDCLGQTFTSRTENWDLTIGLPQMPPLSELPRSRTLAPIGPPRIWRPLLPPVWRHGPIDEQDHASERDAVNWGAATIPGAEHVHPEGAKDTAVVLRCRFYTTLPASDDDDFDVARDSFLSELEDWWERLTSWLGVLTVQDFVRLGGYPRRGVASGSLSMWTSDEHNQRSEVGVRAYLSPRQGIPSSALQLRDLQRCVTAAGDQRVPPAEWLFIRDARSLLTAGEVRRAVLDAGTAAELAMTTLIDQSLDDANADPALKKVIAESHSTLGQKKGLLDTLRPGLLSAEVKPGLIDRRNAAIHGVDRRGRRWDEITLKQAHEAVVLATDIVEAAHPLVGLLA